MPDPASAPPFPADGTASPGDSTVVLDLRGLRCPLPVLRTRKALAGMAQGDTLTVLTNDPLAGLDIPNFVRESDDRLVADEPADDGCRRFVIRRGQGGVEEKPTP